MDESTSPTRASDAERDAVVAVLRDHGAAGRLELDELEQRVQAALSARTRDQLDALLADLPVDAPKRPRRRRQRPSVPWAPAAFAAALGALAVAGEPWVLWFLFALPCMFGKGRHAGRGLSAR